MEDNEIVLLFEKRDERALAVSEKKYGKYCKAIAANILSSAQDVEECVNDTLLAAWNSIPPQKPNSLKAYLGTICRRLALNRYQTQKRGKRGNFTIAEAYEELEECIPGENVEDLVELARLRAALRDFIRTLPEEQAIMFMQKYWYIRSAKEIATDLKTTEGAVKVSLHRIRAKLKEYLKKEGFDL